MTCDSGGHTAAVNQRFALIYALIFALFCGQLVNFYLTFRVREYCLDSGDVGSGDSSVVTASLSQLEVKNDNNGMKSTAAFSNSNRSKRQANSNNQAASERFPISPSKKEYLLEGAATNVTTRAALEDDLELYHVAGHSAGDSNDYQGTQHHRHHHHHRRKMKPRAAASRSSPPAQPLDDTSGPSVEFFPKPQPTPETQGYIWLTSYSRIPVSRSSS